MATLLAPAFPVAAPLYLPPLHGLMTTATQVPDEPGSRWLLGVAVEPEGWAEAVPMPGAWCGDDPYPDKPATSPPDVEYWVPVNLVTAYACRFGLSMDERVAKVRRQLAGSESKALERAFWSGVEGVTTPDGLPVRRLAIAGTGDPDDPSVLVEADRVGIVNPGYDPGDPIGDVVGVDVRTALAVLGGYLAGHGGGSRGMIHMPTMIGELAAQQDVFTADNRGQLEVLRTRGRGDAVVIGAGYPGTGPGGSVPPDGFVWIHATSWVQFRLGDVQILPDNMAQAYNRLTGDFVVVAERPALAYWSGPVWSALVDLSASVCCGADLTGDGEGVDWGPRP